MAQKSHSQVFIRLDFPATGDQVRSQGGCVLTLLATAIDVEATVAKMGREGILLEPVLMPPRSNRTDLVLMIDQEGSMVPFHELSRQLAETAQRGGRLRQTRVFYFHDYPDEYLYCHPALLNAQPISEVLEEIGERAAVLIAVLVQDNDPIHTSALVQQRLPQWETQGLYIFWLLKYCSEMNLIESEWHQFKTHELAGRMFEDELDLAYAVIDGIEARGQASQYTVKRFRFNSS